MGTTGGSSRDELGDAPTETRPPSDNIRWLQPKKDQRLHGRSKSRPLAVEADHDPPSMDGGANLAAC